MPSLGAIASICCCPPRQKPGRGGKTARTARERARVRAASRRRRVANMMFSRTVSFGKSPLSSGMRETPRRAISAVVMPVHRSPKRRISPATGASTPASVKSVAVFPAPLAPRSATISPDLTSRSRSRTTTLLPYPQESDWAASTTSAWTSWVRPERIVAEVHVDDRAHPSGSWPPHPRRADGRCPRPRHGRTHREPDPCRGRPRRWRCPAPRPLAGGSPRARLSLESSPAAGSSRRRRLGRHASARASPHNLRWPWLSSAGDIGPSSAMPAASSASSTESGSP